jgi:hypothetical protein
MVSLPRSASQVEKRNRSRGAFFSARVFLTTTTEEIKGGGAPTGACHPLSASSSFPLSLSGRGWRVACQRNEPEEGWTRAERSAPAYRRFAAALVPASERQDSAQAALRAK